MPSHASTHQMRGRPRDSRRNGGATTNSAPRTYRANRRLEESIVTLSHPAARLLANVYQAKFIKEKRKWRLVLFKERK